jgi:hypothetical protein
MIWKMLPRESLQWLSEAVRKIIIHMRNTTNIPIAAQFESPGGTVGQTRSEGFVRVSSSVNLFDIDMEFTSIRPYRWTRQS